MAAERQSTWQGSFHFCRLSCLLLIIFGLSDVCWSNIDIYPDITKVGQLVNITCNVTSTHCPHGRVRLASGKDPNGSLTGEDSEGRTQDVLRLTLRITEPQSLHYFCLCDIGNQTYLVGMKKLEAGYPPTPAVNFTCVSFAWDDMECSWTQADVHSLWPKTTWNVTFTAYLLEVDKVARLVGGNKIAHSVHWKLENRTCLVDAEKLSCRVDADETLKYKFYRFSVVAENALGTAKASFNVTTDESIAKPPSPTNMSAISTASANMTSASASPIVCTATLGWTAGGAQLTAMFTIITRLGLQYKLTYRASGRKRNHSQVFVSKDDIVSTVLRDLHPFAEYTVVITSRVAKIGISWSDPVSFSFTACEAVPEVPPVVNSQLGFSYEEDMGCNGEGLGRGVTLYWQGIPEVSGQSNGIVTGYYVMDGDKVVAEADGKARQKSLCVRKLDGGVTYTLVGATAVGRGLRTSKIHVTQQPQQRASVLRLRTCDISVMKTEGSSVEVFWPALSHDGATNVVRENNIYGDSSAASKQRRQDTEHQQYVVFWCQYDGRSQCTGDIKWSPPVRARQQWPHNQTVGYYQVNLTGGSVYDHRFGVALWTPGNVSGGITWAGCVHSNDGDRNKVREPYVSLMYDDIYSAKIKQLECFRGGIEFSLPISRVFYWCRLRANVNSSCTVEMDEIPSCCEQESVRSRVLDGCDYDAVMHGSGSGVAAWIKHLYLHKDYAFSSVRMSKTTNAEPQHAAERMLTSAVIWGTIVGVACVAAIIAVLIRTYLRMTTMNITTIKKVPAVSEALVRDEYADKQQVFGSDDGLYSPKASRKTKIARSLLDRSMPTRGARRQRERQLGAAPQGGGRRGNTVNERQHYAADCLSTSTCCDEEYVGRGARAPAGDDPLSISQTCIGFNVTGDEACAMPATDGLLSRDRYIRSPMADDALYKTAAQAAAAKLQILNWLPISKSSDTSIRQQESVISDCFQSDCAGGTSVSELSVVRRPGSTLNADLRKQFIPGADQLPNQRDMAVAASAGASCPLLATNDELMSADKRSQTGASSQMTASTSCSSLGYWKTSQDCIHQVGHRLSVDEVKAAVIVDTAPKRKLSTEEEYFQARAASSLGRRSAISLVPSSGKLGPCLDYI